MCLHRKNVHLQWWTAVLGLHAQTNLDSEDVQTRLVDRIVIHHRYNRQTKEADIALMHLQEPISFNRQLHTHSVIRTSTVQVQV